MYELLTETKTRVYLKELHERRLPSVQRVPIQARELRLARLQQAEPTRPTSREEWRGAVLGKVGLRVAAAFRSLR